MIVTEEIIHRRSRRSQRQIPKSRVPAITRKFYVIFATVNDFSRRDFRARSKQTGSLCFCLLAFITVFDRLENASLVMRNIEAFQQLDIFLADTLALMMLLAILNYIDVDLFVCISHDAAPTDLSAIFIKLQTRPSARVAWWTARGSIEDDRDPLHF